MSEAKRKPGRRSKASLAAELLASSKPAQTARAETAKIIDRLTRRGRPSKRTLAAREMATAKWKALTPEERSAAAAHAGRHTKPRPTITKCTTCAFTGSARDMRKLANHTPAAGKACHPNRK